MSDLEPPREGDDWFGLSREPLPVGRALDWATLPSCGAVVLFTGTVRDHAEGRTGVVRLEYEAYDEQVEPALRSIAAEARRRWPELGRLVLIHRVGDVELGAASVGVVTSAPHRATAFDAARFAIDTLKETVPIWKREFWRDGADWALGASEIRPLAPADGVATVETRG
jgi:molybdopterin synthase catalytic subunit